MAMEGGAMGGYCETGRVWMARAPATIRMMAMTQAKTGRLRKNLDNMAPPSIRGRGRLGRVPWFGLRFAAIIEGDLFHLSAGLEFLHALGGESRSKCKNQI